jgi:hypothetical protein
MLIQRSAFGFSLRPLFESLNGARELSVPLQEPLSALVALQADNVGRPKAVDCVAAGLRLLDDIFLGI